VTIFANHFQMLKFTWLFLILHILTIQNKMLSANISYSKTTELLTPLSPLNFILQPSPRCFCKKNKSDIQISI